MKNIDYKLQQTIFNILQKLYNKLKLNIKAKYNPLELLPIIQTTNIANETNLLVFNAKIKVTCMCEYGRELAAVTDEVKN